MIIYLKTDNVPKWHAALVFAEKHGYTWSSGSKPTTKYLDDKGNYLRLDINTKTLLRCLGDPPLSESNNGIFIEVI